MEINSDHSSSSFETFENLSIRRSDNWCGLNSVALVVTTSSHFMTAWYDASARGIHSRTISHPRRSQTRLFPDAKPVIHLSAQWDPTRLLWCWHPLSPRWRTLQPRAPEIQNSNIKKQHQGSPVGRRQCHPFHFCCWPPELFDSGLRSLLSGCFGR